MRDNLDSYSDGINRSTGFHLIRVNSLVWIDDVNNPGQPKLHKELSYGVFANFEVEIFVEHCLNGSRHDRGFA